MNAILYARVSTDKQAEKELSIPAQLEAMRQHALRNGWTVVDEVLEQGASAKTAERPALQQLLAKVRSGEANAGVVLVHKIDRFARNVYDHATIKALLLKHGVRLASVVENVDDSVSGQLVENIMASIAQFYSGNLSDEVKKGMRQKVLNGGWPHLPPRGYIQVRSDENRTARVEIHPRDGHLVRSAFELYATGWHSLKTLALALEREGMTGQTGQRLSPAQLQRMLSNRFYMGEIRWKELIVPGTHPALVTPELFETVANVLRHRHRYPGAKGSVNGFPLRGLALCAACRGHMTAGWHKKKFGYYRCARRSYRKELCPAKSYCPSKSAHAQIAALCGDLHLSEEAADQVLRAAERILSKRNENAERRVRSLTANRGRLLDREMRLTEAFAAGQVPAPAYQPAAAKLRSTIQGVETELKRISAKPETLLSDVDQFLRHAKSVWNIYEEFGEAHQEELLREVFQTIVLSEEGVIGFALRAPFDALLKGRDNLATGRTAKDAERVAEYFLETAMRKPTNAASVPS